jgi:phytoene desaturase
MERKVIIVGAGPGGLASAMLLAHAGVEVEVYERLDRVGGRTSTFGNEDYTFDLGPTFFMYPRVLSEIFDTVGYRLEDEVELIKLDTHYDLVFGEGGRFKAQADPQAMAAEVARFSPRDAGGFESFMTDNRAKLGRFRPLLERGFHSWTDLVGLDTLAVLPHLRPHLSLDQELARHFDDPRLRLAFTFQSKYLGMSPFSCPSVFSILSFIEYEYGIFHVTGGLGQVSVAMARVAEQLGARIHLDTPVEEVLYEGDRAVGVRIAEGERYADAVVVNGDFARAMQRIVPEDKRPSWDDARIDKSAYSCSTFMLYLGVEGTYDELEHHTVYVAEDYQRNMDQIEQGQPLGEDFSVYVQNASVTDPTLAPEGHSTLYVLVPITNLRADIDWESEKGAMRDRVIAQLEKLGITDLERRIRYERVVTPDDWSQQYEVHLGAVFNLAHSLDQMMIMRPGNRFDDGQGLYIVGGGTHPGSGLPVIYEGARIAAKALLEDLPMLQPVIKADTHDVTPTHEPARLADVA